MAPQPSFKMYQPPLAAIALLAVTAGCSGGGPEREDLTNHHPDIPSMGDYSDGSKCDNQANGCYKRSRENGPDTASGKCVQPSSTRQPEPDNIDDEVLSAVGILELEQQVGAEPEPFCTGLLIDANKVLTACHCVEASAGEGKKVWFRHGSDLIPVDWDRSDCDPAVREGGYKNVGSDVAVMVLEEDADEPAVPLELRSLIGDKIKEDESLTAVGHFFQRNGKTQPGADRQVAKLALRALAGRFLEKAFRTSENFNNCIAEYWKEESDADLRIEERAGGVGEGNIYWMDDVFEMPYDPSRETMTEGPDGDPLYETLDVFEMTLLEGYQAWFDGGLGGAQPCKGDSGSPLVKRTEEGFAVYGIVSGSIIVDDSEPRCAFGAVYAIFSEETLEWFRNMRDPRDGPDIEIPRIGTLPDFKPAAAGRLLERTGVP